MWDRKQIMGVFGILMVINVVKKNTEEEGMLVISKQI